MTNLSPIAIIVRKKNICQGSALFCGAKRQNSHRTSDINIEEYGLLCQGMVVKGRAVKDTGCSRIVVRSDLVDKRVHHNSMCTQ